MSFKPTSLRSGTAFDNPPPRSLFGNNESDRQKYFSGQFSLITEYWSKVPWRQWGIGSAKSFGDFLREIGSGEVRLSIKNGELIRNMDIIICFVFTKDGRWLVEQPQHLADGRIRNRRFPYISERLRLGETPENACLRALKEESGGYIIPNTKRLLRGEKFILDENHPYNTGSVSYPGIKSRKIAYTFAIILNNSEYKARYRELDISGSITIHSWKAVSDNYFFSNSSLATQIHKYIKM